MPFNPLSSLRRVSAAAVCAALACLAPPAAAAEDLAAVLARPVSPGSVALLVEHATQPDAHKRLIEAVKHQDAAVRAVAARVAFVTMSKGAAPALISAVAKEEHVHTGAEQVRALMALYGEPGDTIVLGAVKRLGAPAALAMAESLARTRPADIPRYLPTLAAIMAKPDMALLGAAISTAAIQHPTHAADIFTAVLATKNEDLWRLVLDRQRFSTHRALITALLPGLTSADESQRLATLWLVFDLEWRGVALAPDVMAIVQPKPIAAGTAAADLSFEAFVLELMARRRGAAATEADWAGMLVLPEHKKRVEEFDHYAYGYLTDAEVKAIDTVDGDDHDAHKMRRDARQEARDAQKAGAAPAQTLRTLPVFAKGLLADLMAVHRCRQQRSTSFAAGDMKYRTDGRAQGLSIVQTGLSKECEAFVRAALVLTIASVDFPVVPDSADSVLAPFAPAFLACADDPFAAGRPLGAGQPFEQHKVKRRPIPQYPEAYRRSGMPKLEVILRVRVSPAGCVTGVETLRGVLPAFDVEAIWSLFQAKLTPATLGGVPVDTSITHVVFFSLR